MRLVHNIGNSVRNAALKFLMPDAAPVESRYEGGQIWNPRRSRLPGWVQDARYDADTMTRLEILRKARYFERNSALVNRLADLFEEYTVGPNGIRFVPESSDDAWNDRMSAEFAEWGKLCDLTSLQNFGTIQSLAARSWFIDGEVFIIKTRGKARRDIQSYPRIQLVESHRVETPPQNYGDRRFIDGIQVDENGRPEFYWIRDGYGDEAVHNPRPASEVIHIFEPTRPGMYRGLSMLYAVLNDLHDLDDLQILSMDGAKEAAAVTHIIKTKTGELNLNDLRQARFLGKGTKGTSGGSSEDRNAYYADIFAARAKVLKRDDDYAQHQVTRPSESEQALWNILTNKVCMGSGISKQIVMPTPMQGTIMRADLDTQGTFFSSRANVIGGKFEDVYQFHCEWAVRNRLELSDPPVDYRKVKARAPRSITADIGHDSKALINEYLAGWRTLEEICGKLGEDWRDVMKQRAKERVYAAKLEKDNSLPTGSLVNAVLEAIKAQTKTEPAAVPATELEEAA